MRASPPGRPDGALIAYLYVPGRLRRPATRAARGRSREGRRAARLLTDIPRPELRPVPADPRAASGTATRSSSRVEDAGQQPPLPVAADGSAEPDAIVGGELGVTGFDAAGGTTSSTRPRPGDVLRALRSASEPADASVGAAFAARRELSEPERFDGRLEGRHRGRGVDHAPGRLRARPSATGPPEHPRRAVHAVRQPVLRRVPGATPARVTRSCTATRAARRATARSGGGRSAGRAAAGPAGAASTTRTSWRSPTRRCGGFDVLRPASASASSAARTAGYMTSWIVGHTDRFQAACSERAVNNMVARGRLERHRVWTSRATSGAHWFEDPETYLRLSPSTYAQNITTPLLILHSEDDLRCPVVNAEELFTILRHPRARGRVRPLPGGGPRALPLGHAAHRVQRFEIMLDWFDRYLK